MQRAEKLAIGLDRIAADLSVAEMIPLNSDNKAPLFEGNIPNNGWDRPYKGVRTDRYTYVVYNETGEQELYDRRADPYELRNVAGDPAYAPIKARLAAELVRLNRCRGRACDVAP